MPICLNQMHRACNGLCGSKELQYQFKPPFLKFFSYVSCLHHPAPRNLLLFLFILVNLYLVLELFDI